MSIEQAKQKIAEHLENDLLEYNDEEELSDHERDWITYIVDHIEHFTGEVGELTGKGKLYEMLANEWDKSAADVSNGIGLDMARDMLFDQVTVWTSSNLTPEEAGPYIEEGATTPEEVKQEMKNS
jgi:hypothetical protein